MNFGSKDFTSVRMFKYLAIHFEVFTVLGNHLNDLLFPQFWISKRPSGRKRGSLLCAVWRDLIQTLGRRRREACFNVRETFRRDLASPGPTARQRTAGWPSASKSGVDSHQQGRGWTRGCPRSLQTLQITLKSKESPWGYRLDIKNLGKWEVQAPSSCWQLERRRGEMRLTGRRVLLAVAGTPASG